MIIRILALLGICAIVLVVITIVTYVVSELEPYYKNIGDELMKERRDRNLTPCKVCGNMDMTIRLCENLYWVKCDCGNKSRKSGCLERAVEDWNEGNK